jgi:hypothetical protein
MPPRVAFVTIGPSPCTDVLPVIIAETRTYLAPIGFVPSGFAPTAALQRRSRGRRNTSPGAAMAAMAGPPGRQARRSNADGRAGFAPFCNAPSVRAIGRNACR